MGTRLLRTISVSLFALSAVFGSARATAIASVQEAFWQADFAYYLDTGGRHDALPDGVDILCTATAKATSTGCLDRQSATVESSDGVMATRIVDAMSSVLLRNNTSHAFDGTFVFNTVFSAFNPGGPDIGASVDNAAKEYAAFFSVVSGPSLFDLHGCDMQNGSGLDLAKPARKTCGVLAPDSSESEFGLGPLAANGSAQADFKIYIRVDARGDKQNGDPVPEAPAAAFFIIGLVALARRHGVKA